MEQQYKNKQSATKFMLPWITLLCTFICTTILTGKHEDKIVVPIVWLLVNAILPIYLVSVTESKGIIIQNKRLKTELNTTGKITLVFYILILFFIPIIQPFLNHKYAYSAPEFLRMSFIVTLPLQGFVFFSLFTLSKVEIFSRAFSYDIKHDRISPLNDKETLMFNELSLPQSCRSAEKDRIARLQDMIGNGKVEEVLNYLILIFRKNENEELLNDTLQLSAQYKNLMRRIRTNSISKIESDPEKNRISGAILEIIGQLDIDT